VAAQRNQILRDDHMARMSQWSAEMLVFVDESAACERSGHRKYGWAPIGVKATITRPLQRSKRWSILPAFTVLGYISWEIVHGSITKEIFNHWIQTEVLPQCGKYSEKQPFSVLLMDNASIHHSEARGIDIYIYYILI
jgi:hypothetical protein